MALSMPRGAIREIPANRDARKGPRGFDEDQVKDLLKTAILEVLEERKDLVRDLQECQRHPSGHEQAPPTIPAHAGSDP
jgi:hypothetical protein